MRKKGISSITLVVIVTIIVIILGIIIFNKTSISTKQHFIKALQYEVTEISKKVSQESDKIKSVKLKLKSAIDLKKDLDTNQTGLVNYLNKTLFTVDFRYIPGTIDSSIALDADTNSKITLEMYAKLKDGNILANLGNYSDNKAMKYDLNAFPKFILANLKLSKEEKIKTANKLLKYVEKSIDDKNILFEKTFLKVDEIKQNVNQITLKLTSEEFKETMDKLLVYIGEDNKYLTSLDQGLHEYITDDTDSSALLKDMKKQISKIADMYETITVTFNTDDKNNVLNYSVVLLSKDEKVKSRRISVNKISTSKQDFSVSYMEDLNIVAALNYKKQQDSKEEITVKLKNYELQTVVDRSKLELILYMVTNTSTDEKISGNISIARIENNYQATVTAVGMIEKHVIDSVFALNISLSEEKSLDNRLDKMTIESIEEFKNKCSLIKKEVLNIK